METREIQLTKGLVAIVDADLFEWLNQWNWYAHKGTSTTYAVTEFGGKVVRMHRLIMGVTDPKMLVDHENGNGLLNLRSNLRTCTKAQNCYNKRVVFAASGFKGVFMGKGQSKWTAKIQFQGKQYHLGVYDTREQAAAVYDAKARELFGSFAKTNSAISAQSKEVLTESPTPQRMRVDNKSGYIGAYSFASQKRWIAVVRHNKMTIRLGQFSTAEDAARARDAYIIANNLNRSLNFPEAHNPSPAASTAPIPVHSAG